MLIRSTGSEEDVNGESLQHRIPPPPAESPRLVLVNGLPYNSILNLRSELKGIQHGCLPQGRLEVPWVLNIYAMRWPVHEGPQLCRKNMSCALNQRAEPSMKSSLPPTDVIPATVRRHVLKSCVAP